MQDIKISVILEGCHETEMLSHFLFKQHTEDGYWLINHVWVVSFTSTLSIGLVVRKMCQGSKKKMKKMI